MVIERGAQFVGQREMFAHFPVEFLGVEAIAVTAFLLRGRTAAG
jgi:hypothetical protein